MPAPERRPRRLAICFCSKSAELIDTAGDSPQAFQIRWHLCEPLSLPRKIQERLVSRYRTDDGARDPKKREIWTPLLVVAHPDFPARDGVTRHRERRQEGREH